MVLNQNKDALTLLNQVNDIIITIIPSYSCYIFITLFIVIKKTEIQAIAIIIIIIIIILIGNIYSTETSGTRQMTERNNLNSN